MAQAIQKVIRTEKTREILEQERLADVTSEVATDADGVVQSLKLLQALHDRGVLELVTALFDRGDKVLGRLVDILAKPESERTIQVLLAAVASAGKLDAEAASSAVRGLSGGLAYAAQTEPPDQPMGVFDLMRQIKDPDVSAGIATGLAFLKGLGQTMRADAAEAQQGDG